MVEEHRKPRKGVIAAENHIVNLLQDKHRNCGAQRVLMVLGGLSCSELANFLVCEKQQTICGINARRR